MKMKTEEIIHLLTQPAVELKKQLIDRLEGDYGYSLVCGDDFIYATPQHTLPVALCAHIDVVGVVSPTKDEIVLSQSGTVLTLKQVDNNVISLSKSKTESPQVLGGDDRAGVFAVMDIVADRFQKNEPLPIVIFTDKEEVGGLGAKELCSWGLLNNSDKLRLFIEFDRKGANEVVTYSGENPPELANLVESYGFIYDCGSYSDVADFTDTTGVANINVSCGFHNAHTRKEKLHIDELLLSITRIKSMLNDERITGRLWEQGEGVNDCCGYGCDYEQYILVDELYELLDGWYGDSCLPETAHLVYQAIKREKLEDAIFDLLMEVAEGEVLYEILLEVAAIHFEESESVPNLVQLKAE